MKPFSALLLLTSSICSFAVIPLENSIAQQENSGEHLYITAHSVQYDTLVTDSSSNRISITAKVKAIVEKVNKSESNLSISDSISFSYTYRPEADGGINNPIIDQDGFVPAYLNHISGTEYKLGAGYISFRNIHLDAPGNGGTFGNSTSLVWGDELWNAHHNTSMDGAIQLGKFELKRTVNDNNLTISQNDSILMRCFIDNDTLMVSPSVQLEGGISRGIISPNGASISFHLLNETANELVFTYPTTYSCLFGDFINLYEHNLEVRTLAYNKDDGRTQIGILDPLVYGTYTTFFITPGSNSLIMKNGKKVTIESDSSSMSYKISKVEDVILLPSELDSLNSTWVGSKGQSTILDSIKVMLDSIVDGVAYIQQSSVSPVTLPATADLTQSLLVREGETVNIAMDNSQSAVDTVQFFIKTVFAGEEKDGDIAQYVEIVSLTNESNPTSLLVNTPSQLTLPAGKQEIFIFSANGRIVHKARVEYIQVQSMLSKLNLSAGFYLLKAPHMTRSILIK